MKCQNEYCIYQKNGKCICEETSIDSFGRCENMILVSLNEKSLEKAKNKQLEKLCDK